jgi:predicted PurR-regulated permease PerM
MWVIILSFFIIIVTPCIFIENFTNIFQNINENEVNLYTQTLTNSNHFYLPSHIFQHNVVKITS